ncbi:uncharacterized protein SPPG_02532 [Spizellomyces punctatus DAOM BR117]|uniref:adenylate cyclase n=1 Tax=Spizellomyces punctatus (strain DAOM BR117) TaxID=645134 RepID=A0A0L0HMI5_SPIPD|nr:uncharacterized protein SPPG_02532 [Spizellomyces punctatus DAOM BR117]KND02029.1 hypothetical protein SPPG_02532 [Spizellomyces punctatus DAOM BR117]|eukprot:XP_016610068.1 hypothetical protein SPPG_02532 [Spizellomyces punctatus DAOM BR117]
MRTDQQGGPSSSHRVIAAAYPRSHESEPQLNGAEALSARRGVIRPKSAGPRTVTSEANLYPVRHFQRQTSMADGIRPDHGRASSGPTKSAASSTGTVDRPPCEPPETLTSPPGQSIWTRFKRSGPWTGSSKKELNLGSIDDLQLARIEEGSPRPNPVGKRKGNRRPRSATFGQHSERRLGQDGGKGRWWAGSTHQMGSSVANGVAEEEFQDSFVDDPVAEGRDDITCEFDVIRNLRSAPVENADESSTHVLGGPQDYLQTTMQDLFARASFATRTSMIMPGIPSTAPYNPRRAVLSTGISAAGGMYGNIQSSRRLSDRGDGVRSLTDRSPHISIGGQSGSLRASRASSNAVLSSTDGNRAERVSISGLISETTLPEQMIPPTPEAPSILSPTLQLAPWVNFPLMDSPSTELTDPIARTSQNALPAVSDTLMRSESAISKSDTHPPLSVYLKPLDTPNVLLGANLDIDSGLTPRHSEHVPALASDEPAQVEHEKSKSAVIPAVKPTGLEPPDLSASSLNFEGGVLPTKYVARGSEVKKGTFVKRKSRADGLALEESDGAAPEVIRKKPLSVWKAIKQPLSESPSTGWNLRFTYPIENLYRVWLFHLWVKPFQATVLSLLVFFWLVWFVIEFFVFETRPLPVHLGSGLVNITGIIGICWSFRESWERRWNAFMQIFFVMMALETLNYSAHYLFHALSFDPERIKYGSNSNRFIFIQTCIAAFGQVPFYNYAMLMWVFLIGQIVIEGIALLPQGYDVKPLVANWVFYTAATVVGTYFRYTGEVHLRKAFIKYRIAYRNQARLFAAREQSEYLLSMILPAKVIETLHSLQGKVSDRLILSTHETFLELRGVTVMFADLVGFTEFSSSITADALVEILSELFSEFDALVTELGLETIKTIGDCVQIAGGVPEQLETEELIADHAERVCAMALIMLTTTRRVSASLGRQLRLRIGIHTGTVIGGVMGLWKFKYDIWSRDVDIASIMEQTGRPNIPHVSEQTYTLLQNRLSLSFMPAPDVAAFGHPIKTYEMLVLEEEGDALERLAARLRIQGELPALHGKRTGSSGHGSGEAVTAAAVRQAFGASNAMVFTDLPNSMGKRNAPGKNNLGNTVNNFENSINFLTSEFKDHIMERDYRDNYIRNWPGALIFASGIVFFVYVCIFYVHISIFEDASPAIFAVEAVIGFTLLLDIIFAYRLNRPLREQFIRVMDKGDRLASALWMTSTEEVGRKSDEHGDLNSAAHDPWRWFRPNVFALSTITAVFLSTCLHLSGTQPETLTYHSGCMVLCIVACLVYPGVKIVYINFAIVLFTFTFFIAQMCVIVYKYGSVQQNHTIMGVLPDMGLMGLVLVAVVRANRSYDIISRMNFYIKRQTEVDYAETKRTQAAAERMLLNILPLRVVQRLKDNPATHIADDKAEVSILFAFISNFGPSDDASEIENIWTLNDIICDIDALARSRSVEKIKTIGTKYMAMAEPQPDVPEHHLQRLCDFALDLLDVVRAFNARSGQSFALRTGIHVGPAVCGLIGTRTFTFDVWGDTVNVASRMESTGLDEHIQVTQAVYDTLKDRYRFKPRGRVYVKGKGELDTYFLLGPNDGSLRRRSQRRVSMVRDSPRSRRASSAVKPGVVEE